MKSNFVASSACTRGLQATNTSVTAKVPGANLAGLLSFNRKFSVSKKLLTYDLSAYVFFGLFATS